MIENVAETMGEYGARHMRGLYGSRVPYIEGGRTYRSGVSYPPVRVPAREKRRPIRDLLRKTDWDGHGILAVIAVLAAAVLADGLALMLIAWWQR